MSKAARSQVFKVYFENQSPVLSTRITDQSSEAKRDQVLGTRMDRVADLGTGTLASGSRRGLDSDLPGLSPKLIT